MRRKYFQINLVFILNIVRILVSKLQADSTPNVAQVRRVRNILYRYPHFLTQQSFFTYQT